MSVLDALGAEHDAQGRAKGLSRYTPWIVSVSAHVALIALGTVIVWSTSAPEFAPAPVVRFDDPGLAPPPLPEPTLQEEADLVPLNILPRMPVVEDAGEPVLAGESSLDVEIIPSAPKTAAPPAPSPSQSRVEFAGLGASEARDIVYVVDASGSMVTALPDVLNELRRSVRKLHPTQRIGVVLMQPDKATGGEVTVAPLLPNMKKPIVIDVTTDVRVRLEDWLRTVRAGGASNLGAALETALKMKPDAIFVLGRIGAADLVDADIDTLMSELDRLNPADAEGDRRTTIKTIQFLDVDPQDTLRIVGQTHGGEGGYTFLTLDALLQRLEENP